MTSPSSSNGESPVVATCKAVVVDCPGIGQMKWCEQCAIYFGKDQPCPSSKEKQREGATPRTDAAIMQWTMGQVLVSADFARQLERELNAALDAQKRP